MGILGGGALKDDAGALLAGVCEADARGVDADATDDGVRVLVKGKAKSKAKDETKTRSNSLNRRATAFQQQFSDSSGNFRSRVNSFTSRITRVSSDKSSMKNVSSVAARFSRGPRASEGGLPACKSRGIKPGEFARKSRGLDSGESDSLGRISRSTLSAPRSALSKRSQRQRRTAESGDVDPNSSCPQLGLGEISDPFDGFGRSTSTVQFRAVQGGLQCGSRRSSDDSVDALGKVRKMPSELAPINTQSVVVA